MAYVPIKYTVKDDLMNFAVIRRIYANDTFEVSADDEQQAFLDTIESLWDRGGSSVVNSTYNDMVNLIQNNQLVVGSWYKFDYQTIHKIPYTTVLNYGPIETLMALAIAPNKFDEQVISIDHPEDSVYWRYDDNFVLQIVESPLIGNVNFAGAYPFNYDDLTHSQPYLIMGQKVPRPGRIYKRVDNRRNLLTGYDFRAVKVRRYALHQPVTPFIGTVWSPGNTYNQGTYLQYEGVYYRVLVTHTATPDVTTSNVYFYQDLTPHIRSINHPSMNNPFQDLPGYEYVSATPSVHEVGGLSFLVDNTNFIDVTTFDNDDEIPNPDEPGSTYCFNVEIEPVIGAYIEAPDWEFYPNLCFNKYCANIRIGKMTINSTIFRTVNCNVGGYNSGLMIRGFDYQVGSINIGDYNMFSYFRTQFASQKISLTVGNNNTRCYFLGSDFIIGNTNEDLTVYQANSGTIGDNNLTIILNERYGGSVSSPTIGSFNNYVTLLSSTQRTKIGNSNNVVYLAGTGHTVGNANYSVVELSEPGDSVEGNVYFTGANTIENNCSIIQIVGNNNTYKCGSGYIRCNINVTYNNTTFEERFQFLTFGSNTPSSSFTNVKFGGIPTWSSKVVDLAANPSMSGKDFNIILDNGANIGALYVSSYTDPTTFTTNCLKLN